MKNNTIIVAVVAIIIVVIVGAYVVGYGNSSSYGSPVSTTVQSTGSNPYGTVGSSGSTTIAASKNTTTISQQKNSSSSSANYTVMVETSQTLGTYLANASGYTLYTYGSDVQNSGKSNCNGGCASAWPPFYTASLVLPNGLNASEFTTITRNDGTPQLAYKGWPLYKFGGDSAAGQTNGENEGGFVVAAK